MLWHLFKKYKCEFFALLLFVILLVISKFLGVSCIIYKLTGVKCPTCNMTRAIISLIKGDICSYVRLNVMAVPVLSAFLVVLFINNTCKYKIFLNIYAVIILVVNILYYISNLF